MKRKILPNKKQKTGMPASAMVKYPSKNDERLNEICIRILERVLSEPGITRSSVARGLDTVPASITKWLSRSQRISSIFVSRILDKYGGGMTIEKIDKLIELFEDKPETFDNLIAILESGDETAIKKLESDLIYILERLKR